MTIHPSRAARAAFAMLLAGASIGCAKTQPGANAPTAVPAGAAPAPGVVRSWPAPVPTSREARQPMGPGGAPAEPGTHGEEEDAELVVSGDVVARCPTLAVVRRHMSELDEDMLWLVVLESIGECMGEGGPLSQQNLGVSGDEAHRHIVREVLSAHGIAPTRVVAKPAASAPGAAECQGGLPCDKRVEITIVAP
jgi:hypothetical protein